MSSSSVARPILRRISRFKFSSTSQSTFLFQRDQKLSLCHPSFFLSPKFAFFKAGDDENLTKVLQSEIDCVHKPKDPRDINVPKGFWFEIIDSHGDQTITLKRKYGTENIQVTVYMDLDIEADRRKKNIGYLEGTTIQPSISLHITVDKGQGFILEFVCKFNSDELEIESLANISCDFDAQKSYQGPEFSDLDENLQRALHKYLEVRGISSSLYSFLYEYMINKDERVYLKWLRNIKEFVLK